ncbi:MAG TPA: GntR family transcriptional regulator [Mycobacterium sp.]|nr:GntR family transcriptional regulator [Mycolicibacterium sp.]HPX38711.1 GntR family transcriptional regulator [Mycobacterium sp.]HQC78680.1 GntR family transcriptional regulator [Mycobacterium sp.]
MSEHPRDLFERWRAVFAIDLTRVRHFLLSCTTPPPGRGSISARIRGRRRGLGHAGRRGRLGESGGRSGTSDADRKLAEQCGVARTTVRRVVQELRHAGLVVPTSGRGLRVARSPNASADALWPQQLFHPTRPTTPNPTARGALIAQAEDIHRGMAVLAEEIKAAKPIDDPGVLAHLMTILADIASAQARILATLAIGLRANYATEGR